MPSCCRAAPCEEIFDARTAEWDLRSYRRQGLGTVEREMLASVPEQHVTGGRVLEIGGGIGALQAELLKRGAASGEVVELISAYGPYALELARELGVAERASFRVVDLLADPGAAQPADVVLMNKVICCSGEGLELTRVAAGLTRGVLVMSYPRDRWLFQVAQRVQHAVFRLLGRSYRFYVRSSAAIEAAAASAGLRKVASGGSFVWERSTFARTAPAAGD